MRPELLNPKMMTMLTITNLLIVGKLRSVPAETIATTDVGLLKPTPFSPSSNPLIVPCSSARFVLNPKRLSDVGFDP